MIQNRFTRHPDPRRGEGSRTDVIPVLYRDHRYFSAFHNNVCFEWHFARSHIHFVRVLSLRNATSPQRITRGAPLCNVTARYVLSAVTAQPSVSHKRLVLTRRDGESERIPEYINQSVARTVSIRLLVPSGFAKLGFYFEPQGTS